jgi:gas vesicle protein GvpG
MGLVKQLVLLPLAPVRGVLWLTERIADAAELEMDDPDELRRRMAEAQLAYELGEIDERELEAQEDALLERLNRRLSGDAADVGEEVAGG